MSFEFPGSGSVKNLAEVEWYDVIFVVILAAGVLAVATAIDVITHDTLVRPFLDSCNSGHPPAECQRNNFVLEIQSQLGNIDFQIVKTGESYWAVLNMIEFTFAMLVGAVRGVVARSFSVGTIYFFTVYIPMVTGFEDFFYYVGTGRPIPDSLPWLNGMWLMEPVNAVLNHGADVTSTVLYSTMAIYGAVLAVVWYWQLRD